MSILDIPPDQLKRIPLETIVLMMVSGFGKGLRKGMGITLEVDGMLIEVKVKSENK